MLGKVVLLRRYPVKSMLGEELAEADVTAAGLRGDRRLALVHDKTGKVASAKYPRLWRDLLLLRASTGAGAGAEAVRITFPGGRELSSTDQQAGQVLSEFLGEPVTLAATPPDNAELDRAVPDAVLSEGLTAAVPATIVHMGAASPGGTFVDFAPLHLLTTSTLAAIGACREGGPADPARFRPNIVIATGTPGFAENDWADRDLAIGTGLVIRVIARTPRCAVPALRHGPGAGRDPDALRALARHNRIVPLAGMPPEPCAGVYAQVLRPGVVRTGDPVVLLP